MLSHPEMMNQILSEEPDLVVSGINHGANLGDDIIYSGTVAAATEGRHMGLPAIAVSLTGGSGEHFTSAAKVVTDIINLLQLHPLAADQILNINVPDLAYEDIRGVKSTRQGKRHRSEDMIKAKDAQGKDIYWYGRVGSELDASEGTDFHAIANNFCSVTPLSIDMTAYASLDNLSHWIKKF